MPNTMAAGVLIILNRGSPISLNKLSSTPLVSRRTTHARVRSRKFIHMGRMNRKITKPDLPSLLPDRISASG